MLTPREVAADRAAWRHIFKTSVPPPTHIKRYERTAVTPNVFLYSAGVGASTLIVCMCDRKRQLMTPLAMMLQNLDERRYDVLTLSDPRILHFDRGIEDFGDSMPEMAERIKSIARQRGYTVLISYGCSMGGLPALRIGGLLEVSRAISCGGLFAWHVNRLLHDEHTVGAFDPICACRMPFAASCYLLFSDGVEEDIEAAARISAIMPQAARIPVSCERHNFVLKLSLRGNAGEYFSHLFDLDREPDGSWLAALAQ